MALKIQLPSDNGHWSVFCGKLIQKRQGVNKSGVQYFNITVAHADGMRKQYGVDPVEFAMLPAAVASGEIYPICVIADCYEANDWKGGLRSELTNVKVLAHGPDAFAGKRPMPQELADRLGKPAA
jgi:hypothetical protein